MTTETPIGTKMIAQVKLRLEADATGRVSGSGWTASVGRLARKELRAELDTKTDESRFAVGGSFVCVFPVETGIGT